VCSGATILAAAGLLDGRSATSHWSVLDQLRREYPNVAVADDAVWVRDGNVYTSAGATTGIDLAFALVEEDLGPTVARELARWMVVFVRRPSRQSQASVRTSLPPPATADLRRAVDHAIAEPGADLSVGALAARTALSPRHFARLFRAEYGATPARFVERVRLEAAQQLLESSDAPLEVVARSAGFNSLETMRRAFRRVLHSTPGEVRRHAAAPKPGQPPQQTTERLP
jgi:transcriptional regulator GlxA family with amidase domain